MDSVTEAVIIEVGIAMILALGYWITVNTGKFSFGHAGFMAIGAYTSSILTVNYDWSLLAAMLAGGLVAAAAGGLVGVLTLRLSLLYLAVVTLAFAQLVEILLGNWEYVDGVSGMSGMSGTTVGHVVGFGLVLVGYLWLLTRSRLGLSYAAVREDELAARAAGLNTTGVLVGAFAQSAFVTGVGGALSAHYLLYIAPENFGAQQSLLIILYVVLGGIQLFWGALVGAGVLALLPLYVDFLEGWYTLFYGLLFVVLMIVRPQGLIGRGGLRRHRRTPAVTT